MRTREPDVGVSNKHELTPAKEQAPDQDVPVRFASVLVFSKREAFELCEACAEAERALLRCGKASEAARMAALFELAEGRLSSS